MDASRSHVLLVSVAVPVHVSITSVAVPVHDPTQLMSAGFVSMLFVWPEQSCGSSATPSLSVSAQVGRVEQHSVSVQAAYVQPAGQELVPSVLASKSHVGV